MLHVNIISFNPCNSLERQERLCHFTKEEKMKLKVFKQLSQNSIVHENQNQDLKPRLPDLKTKTTATTTLFPTADQVAIQQSPCSGDAPIQILSNFLFLIKDHFVLKKHLKSYFPETSNILRHVSDQEALSLSTGTWTSLGNH